MITVVSFKDNLWIEKPESEINAFNYCYLRHEDKAYIHIDDYFYNYCGLNIVHSYMNPLKSSLHIFIEGEYNLSDLPEGVRVSAEEIMIDEDTRKVCIKLTLPITD